jgi:hypothetical protein
VSLSSAAASIDAGTASYTLSAWIGGFSTQEDTATVSVTFYDAKLQQLGASATIGSVSVTERSGTTSLLQRSISGSIPAGARSATVKMNFIRAAGTSNDGYLDDVSLDVIQSGGNLLVNGDAEAVAAASTAVISIPGWTSDGNVSILRYGSGDFPSTTSPGPSTRGNNFFYGGNVGAASASQSVSLSSSATSIDAGTASYTLSAWIGGFSTQADTATVSITFFDAKLQQLGSSATIGSVSVTERASTTSLLQRSTSGSIPAGARSATVKMDFIRAAGTANDGYVDDVSLVLAQTGGTATTLTTRADCVFNWGEKGYPELFSPAGAASKVLGPYYYRYYSATNSYLGISSSDEHLLYLGAMSRNALLDLGLLSNWLSQTGCR